MRLIEIAAIGRHGGPLHRPPFIGQPQRPLEPADTAKQLGRKPDFVAEDLYEPFRAEADLPSHIRNRARARQAAKLPQRKGYGRVP